LDKEGAILSAITMAIGTALFGVYRHAAYGGDAVKDWRNLLRYSFLKCWNNGKHPSSTGFLFLLCWKNEKHASRCKKRTIRPKPASGTMKNILPVQAFFFYYAGRMKNIFPA
jgi:hypothetical protein